MRVRGHRVSRPAVLALSILLLGSACGRRPPSAPIGYGVQADTGPLSPLGGELLLAWLAFGAIVAAVAYAVPARSGKRALRRVTAEMTERALSLQEEDRRHIARELHDGAGQALTAARLHLAALRSRVHAQEGEAIALILGQIDVAMAEIRRSTRALSPPALAELGLTGALRRHCDDLALASALRVACEIPDGLPPLEATVETACFRIVQEALSNAARHARAREAWVRLEANTSALQLEIGDDGIGLGGAAAGGAGFGLESIRQRARLAGGSLTVFEGEGPGPRIRVTLPRPGGGP